MRRSALLLEFAAIFLALPLAYRFGPFRIPALPLLWLVAGYAAWQLLRDPDFDRRRLWNPIWLQYTLKRILPLFAIAAAGIWLGVHFLAPQLEWNLVRQQPWFWLLLMVAYPVLSVYPQGIVYRSFFFQRYDRLFGSDLGIVLASAATFGFMHLIFRNWLAVGLTFAGGLLFAWRYRVTKSLLTSNIEHALYGCWLFTVGLGQFFYHGNLGTAHSLLHK